MKIKNIISGLLFVSVVGIVAQDKVIRYHERGKDKQDRTLYEVWYKSELDGNTRSYVTTTQPEGEYVIESTPRALLRIVKDHAGCMASLGIFAVSLCGPMIAIKTGTVEKATIFGTKAGSKGSQHKEFTDNQLRVHNVKTVGLLGGGFLSLATLRSTLGDLRKGRGFVPAEPNAAQPVDKGPKK